jgi:hypothetical protein
MDETYRMLGREHEADLEREAFKWRRAAEAGPPEAGVERHRLRKPVQLVVARVAGFVGRAARVEA